MPRYAQTHQLELIGRMRKGLVLYHYWIDPQFGWMNARIQSWLPFSIQVCLNGREWLAQMLDENGIGYRRHDNCFTAIDDIAKAQRLINRQWRTSTNSQRNPAFLGVLCLLCSPPALLARFLDPAAPVAVMTRIAACPNIQNFSATLR